MAKLLNFGVDDIFGTLDVDLQLDKATTNKITLLMYKLVPNMCKDCVHVPFPHFARQSYHTCFRELSFKKVKPVFVLMAGESGVINSYMSVLNLNLAVLESVTNSSCSGCPVCNERLHIIQTTHTTDHTDNPYFRSYRKPILQVIQTTNTTDHIHNPYREFRCKLSEKKVLYSITLPLHGEIFNETVTF